MFDLADHDQLQEGVSTKERVLKIMGSPTVMSDFNFGEIWIYYSEDVKYLLFFKPRIVSRTILTVSFDEENNVKELRRFDLDNDEKKLNFVSNHTVVEGHKTGFFKSFFSNVGQVKPQ